MFFRICGFFEDDQKYHDNEKKGDQIYAKEDGLQLMGKGFSAAFNIRIAGFQVVGGVDDDFPVRFKEGIISVLVDFLASLRNLGLRPGRKLRRRFGKNTSHILTEVSNKGNVSSWVLVLPPSILDATDKPG